MTNEQSRADMDQRGQIIYQRTEMRDYWTPDGQREDRPEVEERHVCIRYLGRGSHAMQQLILKLRHGSDGGNRLYWLSSNPEQPCTDIDLGSLEAIERLGQHILAWVQIEREREARTAATYKALDGRGVRACAACGFGFHAWPQQTICDQCQEHKAHPSETSEIPF